MNNNTSFMSRPPANDLAAKAAGATMTVGLKSFMESTLWVRTGVAVAPTTVTADAAGFGAFTSAKLKRGSFLGAYGAPCWRRANGFTRYRGANDYVMQAGGWRAAPPTGAGSACASRPPSGNRRHGA